MCPNSPRSSLAKNIVPPPHWGEALQLHLAGGKRNRRGTREAATDGHRAARCWRSHLFAPFVLMVPLVSCLVPLVLFYVLNCVVHAVCCSSPELCRPLYWLFQRLRCSPFCPVLGFFFPCSLHALWLMPRQASTCRGRNMLFWQLCPHDCLWFLGEINAVTI